MNASGAEDLIAGFHRSNKAGMCLLTLGLRADEKKIKDHAEK